MIVLSYIQARELLAARSRGEEWTATSLDLNLTRSEAAVDENGVALAEGVTIDWQRIVEIAGNENTCFVVGKDGIAAIQKFSTLLNRFYSLKPTEKAPTLLVAGFPMHRIKGIDPSEDTRRKIAALSPVYGKVLDTTTGLGYTAIVASKTASRVTTIEIDPTVLEIARQNPWSRQLFETQKIEQRIGSSFEIVATLPAGGFDGIFHDPPTVSLAGELYSGEFYRQLYRVLARRGKLFHYVGNLDSKAGHTVARGAIRRLQEAGFVRVTRHDEAFGLTAQKG